MSRMLPRLGQLARLALSEGSPAGSRSYNSVGGRYSPGQFGKEKPFDKAAHWVPKNPYIESWAYRRDKLETEFHWSGRTAFELGYFMVGLSVGFYALGVWTVRHSDSRNGYPKRDFLWAGSERYDEAGKALPPFRLPDEREWY